MTNRAALRTVLVAVILGLAACGGSSDRKAGYMKKGQEMYIAGNFDKARVEFSNVLQIDPKDIEARFMLAETMSELKDYKGAAGHYLRVIEDDPKHVKARVKMGELYLVSGAPDKVEEMVEQIMNLDPKNPDGIVLRGSVRAQKGDLAGALEDAEKAIGLAPDNVNAAALTASLYVRRKETDRAIEVLKASIGKNPTNTALRTALAKVYFDAGKKAEAEAELAEMVKADPTSLGARLQHATFLIGMERIDDAEKALREALTAVADKDQTAIKLALAEFLSSKRSKDKAIAELEGWVKADPKAYDLRFALGSLYGLNNNLAKAKETFQAIVKDDDIGPEGLKARTKLAGVALAEKDTALADKLIGEVLKENGRDIDALTLRGQISMTKQDYVTAIGDFRAVNKEQPNNTRITRLLSRAHFLNKEPELARDTLKKAIDAAPQDLDLRADYVQMLAQGGDIAGVVAQLKEVLKISPNNFVALETLFKAHSSKQDWAAAVETANQLKQAYPDRPHGDYFAGLVKQAQQDFEGSIVDFDAALKKLPDAVEPLSQMVKSYLALKQVDKAMARLDEIIAAQPKNPVAANLKGELQLLSGKTDEAVSLFRQASVINPKWPVPYSNMASAFERAQQGDAAVTALKDGIAATEGAPALTLALASLYERQGKVDDAISQYEAALEKAPDALVVANNLAMLLIDHKPDSHDRAKKLIEPLKAANNPAFLDTVGWVQFKTGDIDAAIPNLEQAVKAAPEAAVLQYHLGMALLKKGDKAAATEALKKAVDTKEAYTGLDEAKEALKQLGTG
jgi:tetratricopeptide (TPR) repeat protein